ncbi:hypothetical protein Bbelb_252600 [Branchiostoma belcheri]|nr:hypothetical protein Bbelb_252600 [Branchiostoma belcheri]
MITSEHGVRPTRHKHTAGTDGRAENSNYGLASNRLFYGGTPAGDPSNGLLPDLTAVQTVGAITRGDIAQRPVEGNGVRPGRATGVGGRRWSHHPRRHRAEAGEKVHGLDTKLSGRFHPNNTPDPGPARARSCVDNCGIGTPASCRRLDVKTTPGRAVRGYPSGRAEAKNETSTSVFPCVLLLASTRPQEAARKSRSARVQFGCGKLYILVDKHSSEDSTTTVCYTTGQQVPPTSRLFAD